MTIRKFVFGGLLAMAVVSAQGQEQRGIFGAGQPGEVSVVRMEAKKLGLQDFQMESRQVNGRLAIDAFTSRLGSGVLVVVAIALLGGEYLARSVGTPSLTRIQFADIGVFRALPSFLFGMWLARLEVRILLQELVKRISTIEQTGAHEFLRSNFIGGIKRLPVRIRPN